MSAAKATACGEEPKAATAAPFEDVGDDPGELVTPVGLPVVVDERRLEEPVLVAGVLPEDVVERGEVVEPIAEVGAVIRLFSVSLKTPVMPVRLKGEGEKIIEITWQGQERYAHARELGRETLVWVLTIHEFEGGKTYETAK